MFVIKRRVYISTWTNIIVKQALAFVETCLNFGFVIN